MTNSYDVSSEKTLSSGQADNGQGQLALWSDGPRSAENEADDDQRGEGGRGRSSVVIMVPR